MVAGFGYLSIIILTLLKKSNRNQYRQQRHDWLEHFFDICELFIELPIAIIRFIIGLFKHLDNFIDF
ncbi:hypothetical protein ACGTJS_02485 [Faucicola mancuniensis]|uniref:hypothetical protein n=1 Tax=Faucicola mancuniensis TaxID=1309795 RepID=UPI0039779CE5